MKGVFGQLFFMCRDRNVKNDIFPPNKKKRVKRIRSQKKEASFYRYRDEFKRDFLLQLAHNCVGKTGERDTSFTSCNGKLIFFLRFRRGGMDC